MLADINDSTWASIHTVHPLWSEAKAVLDDAFQALSRSSAGRGHVALSNALDQHIRALNRYAAVTDAFVAAARYQDPAEAAAVILSTVFRARSDEVPETIGLCRALAAALKTWADGEPSIPNDNRVRDAWESVEMALRRRGRRL